MAQIAEFVGRCDPHEGMGAEDLLRARTVAGRDAVPAVATAHILLDGNLRRRPNMNEQDDLAGDHGARFRPRTGTTPSCHAE